jgi:hypothetical protein
VCFRVRTVATLTPSFRDFLPAWVAARPWYRGRGVPALSLIGSYRLDDPAGEVGIETQLVSDGTITYQVPMTYRGTPLGNGARASLIATAEHSELGTRWIYDAESDPLWREELIRLAREERIVETRTGSGDVIVTVSGQLPGGRATIVELAKPSPDASPCSVSDGRCLTVGV